MGDGTIINRSSPEKIGDSNDWISVACGIYHTIALYNEGTNVDETTKFGNNFSISPNPSSDFITITLKPSEGSAIQIYNTLGELVMSAEARHAVPLRINISNLPKGMYFVRIGGETAKFVKY